MHPHADVSYPVTLILSRQWRQYGQWRLPYWDVAGLLPQPRDAKPGSVTWRRVEAEQDEEHLLWSGLWLDLFRDGLQSYYQNLTAGQPCLFILCRDDDPETGMAPTSVSANLADAEAHMETDGIVLTTPLIEPFSNWLAQYVLNNQNALEQQLRAHKHTKKGKRRHV